MADFKKGDEVFFYRLPTDNEIREAGYKPNRNSKGELTELPGGATAMKLTWLKNKTKLYVKEVWSGGACAYVKDTGESNEWTILTCCLKRFYKPTIILT